ncbi:hypothetical protein QTN47_22605 [Danxiaibacter flavus]|uniref:Uncharacterized protein n=1 Tax=Danxiaibacter flavus TaxID=3049108 RepID=A0ABV3ZP27_9BACT|nr:hypothetical protein QNM32_22610 [Chitinophagaceae bacterium DXS]
MDFEKTISELYYKYGSFNVRDLVNNNPDLLNALIDDLKRLTGLSFNVANGLLGYSRVRHLGSTGLGSIGYNRRSYSSSYARKLVVEMLDNIRTTTVVSNTGSGNYVPNANLDEINLDEVEGEVLQNGVSSNLNPNTFSMGMILLHEWGHTISGGQYEDVDYDNNGNAIDGKNEGFNELAHDYNRIRRQMGRYSLQSWRRRKTYNLDTMGQTGYMAMNRTSRRRILKTYYRHRPFRLPSHSKFIKIP